MKYPYNPIKLKDQGGSEYKPMRFIWNKPQTAFDLQKDFLSGRIAINPQDVIKFKTEANYNLGEQSEFIESLLLGFPTTPIYFVETIHSRLTVVDGVKRLLTLSSFMNNEFALTNVSSLSHLNGLTYSDLCKHGHVSKIESVEFNNFVFVPSVPLTVVHDCISRVSKNLFVRQELRNRVYTVDPDRNWKGFHVESGKASKLIRKLAMLHCTKPGIFEEVMVLRILASKFFSHLNFSDCFETALDKAYSELRSFSDQEILDIENQYLKTLKLVLNVFSSIEFSNFNKNNFVELLMLSFLNKTEKDISERGEAFCKNLKNGLKKLESQLSEFLKNPVIDYQTYTNAQEVIEQTLDPHAKFDAFFKAKNKDKNP